VLLLGYHPSYLSRFIKSHDFLMHGNGPLPLPMRNYIAILVSGVEWHQYMWNCEPKTSLTAKFKLSVV